MNMAERRLGMSHNATETYDTFPSEPDNTSKTTANGRHLFRKTIYMHMHFAHSVHVFQVHFTRVYVRG